MKIALAGNPNAGKTTLFNLLTGSNQFVGNWPGVTVAAITGLVAKENIVGTMGVLYGGTEAYANMAAVFTGVTGMSFLIFNLLCAPCFAAMGAIKREMNNAKWFWFAIGYECGFAYLIAFIVNQLGSLFTGAVNGVGGIVEVVLGFVALAGLIYMVVRKKSECGIRGNLWEQ